MAEMKKLFENIFIMLTQITNGLLNQNYFSTFMTFAFTGHIQQFVQVSSQATLLCQL